MKKITFLIMIVILAISTPACSQRFPEFEKVKTLNEGGSSHETESKTLCLIDATGSMGNLLIKVKSVLNNLFYRVKDILKLNKVDEDCVQLQVVAYRNYSSGQSEILEGSSWESSFENISPFLNKLSPFVTLSLIFSILTTVCIANLVR